MGSMIPGKAHFQGPMACFHSPAEQIAGGSDEAKRDKQWQQWKETMSVSFYLCGFH